MNQVRESRRNSVGKGKKGRMNEERERERERERGMNEGATGREKRGYWEKQD